ncbi:MAG: MFS transporter [Gammaproteobacteria bacterium]|nr:MFS transporter [Gammaproteobacteria bacterium]
MLTTSEHTKFATLFFVQNLPRGLLLSVIPISALSILGDAQRISTLFFVVSLGGILAALGMPMIIRTVGNYRAFLLSGAMMLLSLALLSISDPFYFSAGLFCHIFSIASVDVSLTLYMLARVPRSELTKFDPLRACFTVLALTIGPFSGMWLAANISHQAPFILSACFVLLSITYFRKLKLHQVVIPKSDSLNENPYRYLLAFMKQPRLRLAYGLVCARSSWWLMFVVYTPIYIVQIGLGELVAAAAVSLGSAWTLSVPFWGWVGRKYGVRTVLMSGFISASMLTMLVFSFSSLPTITVVLLIFSALGTTMLDGVANVLFYRAVKRKERSEMSAVFVTYRDVGNLAAPGLFAVLLKFFALPVVFFSASVWMLVGAWHCRYIPKQMK